MSDRLLNYCLLFSFALHIFLVLFIKLPSSTSLNVSSFIPIELVTIKELIQPTQPKTQKIILNTSSINSDLVLRSEKIYPYIPLVKKDTVLSNFQEIERTNNLRGGATYNDELVLPLQSSLKPVDLEVSFTSKREYVKAMPEFEEGRLELIGNQLLVTGKPSVGLPSTADSAGRELEKLLIDGGKTSFIEQYRRTLIERLRSVIEYPEWARESGVKGQVTLEVLIKRNGVVSDIQVFKSSGNSSLDEEARRSIASVNSFPAFPEKITITQAKVLIPVNYNLHWSEVENLLKKTSLSSPVNRKALELLEKGLVELDYKRLEAAKLNFQTAIELEPEFAVAYFYLGSVLFEQDLLTEAMAAFEKALSIDPHNEDLRELINELRDLTSYP